MKLGKLQEYKFKIMKKIGISDELMLRMTIRDHNDLVDMRYAWIPFGSRLAKKQHLDEEELVKRLKEKKI